MKKHTRFLLVALAVVAALSAAACALAAPAREAIGTEPPVTESLSVLTDNPQFVQHGFQVRAVSDAEDPVIDRNTAIATAVEEAAAQARTETSAASVNAVLVDFTDTETPVLPETGVSMTNVRVWIVTFSGVTMARGGPAGAQAEPVLADLNVVIDAYSGEILETFAYAA